MLANISICLINGDKKTESATLHNANVCAVTLSLEWEGVAKMKYDAFRIDGQAFEATPKK